jgi:hypothetical protein
VSGVAPREKYALSLSNHVSASSRPHFRRVHRSSRNIAALTFTKCFRLAAHLQSQFALQNDVRRLARMCVLGITGIRPILPDVSLRESLLAQLLHDFLLVHACNYTALENGDALPAAMGVAAERACRLQERSSLIRSFIRLLAEQRLEAQHWAHPDRAFLCRPAHLAERYSPKAR